MGLFERAGRKVERFKQAAQDAAEDEATHECVDCGERFFAEKDACPECGGEVVALQADDTDADDTGDSAPDADADAAGADESAPDVAGADDAE